MLSIKALVRPTRSAINPKRTPPMPDANRVKVLSQPAPALVMPNAVIRCAMTRLYSMTSNASSAQPRDAAISVRFCADVASEIPILLVAIAAGFYQVFILVASLHTALSANLVVTAIRLLLHRARRASRPRPYENARFALSS